MIYVDTSVIVKLYIREEYSREASNWLRTQDEAVPLTPFHELELTNAIKLKRFRREMTGEEAEIVIKRFSEHERRGVFYRPQIHWANAFALAIDLSTKHTEDIGSRSLDIIHVASALSMKAGGFLTFDERQSKLAIAAGLRIEDWRKA
jgi:predicted nucleic acid-binding protein